MRCQKGASQYAYTSCHGLHLVDQCMCFQENILMANSNRFAKQFPVLILAVSVGKAGYHS